MRIPAYIYCPSAHRLFKIDRCRGRCFKWHTTEHTKTGQVAKAKQASAKIYKIFRHELFTLCVAIQCFSMRVDDAKKKIDTYLSWSIAKSVNGAKTLRR
jgi:hypothetical protein